jgi:1-acyl-sn-glycerol-3-phosphate acyltransferase
MREGQRQLALKVAKSLLPPDEFDRIMGLPIANIGFGYDQFGMEKESAILAYAFVRYIYKYYFRVKSYGHENIPLEGPGLIASNHSGVLPIDAVMVAVDIAHKLEKPRYLRTVVDNFAGFLPFVNVFFYRVGQVIGARRNFLDLLRSDELVGVFPEGTKGLGKPFAQRYNLAKFNVGFIELSLQTKSPIIPTCVIGAEEQNPMIFNMKSIARMFQFPYFPVTANMMVMGLLGVLPLPVRYHIYYGEPLRFYEEYGPETVDEPETIRMLAHKVQLTVQEMIDRGLQKRTSIFG